MDAFNPQIEPARPPWKVIAIISGAVALAVLIILGAVWFVRSRQVATVDMQNLTRVEAQLRMELQGCAEETDPAACRLRKVKLATEATGAASLCSALAGAEFDDCVWSVARERKDAATCEDIVDETSRTTCANAVNIQLALSTKDASYCDNVTDPGKRDQCAASVAGPLTVANCASRGNEQATCDVLAAFDAAVAAKNPELCAALSDETYVRRCQDQVGPGDRDLDGLDANEEASYGSSDTSIDTDGDGFSDADEVENGYNPNGAGRL